MIVPPAPRARSLAYKPYSLACQAFRLPRSTALAALVFAALALAFTASASAKPHKKATGSVRPEDDPLLAGDAPAFAKATVAFRVPADGAELAPGDVALQLDVEGYALGAAPGAARSDSAAAQSGASFAILLVDNDGALRVDDASAPLRLSGLAPGPHTLRAVLSRPWGEVVKAKGAFAMTRFWVGPRLADSDTARAAEQKIWPDPKHPILTYVFPLGELRQGLSLAPDGPASAPTPEPAATALAPQAPDAAAPGINAAAPGTNAPAPGINAPAPSADASAADAAEPPPEPSARTWNAPLPPQRELDFYLAGAQLKEKGRANKVRVVINKRELPIVRAWRPLPLVLDPGRNRITIDLLDRRSTVVKNAVNRTDRYITQAGPGTP